MDPFFIIIIPCACVFCILWFGIWYCVCRNIFCQKDSDVSSWQIANLKFVDVCIVIMLNWKYFGWDEIRLQKKLSIFWSLEGCTFKYLPTYNRGSFRNRFLKSIKPHDLGSILSTSYFYSFTLEGLYIIF